MSSLLSMSAVGVPSPVSSIFFFEKAEVVKVNLDEVRPENFNADEWEAIKEYFDLDTQEFDPGLSVRMLKVMEARKEIDWLQSEFNFVSAEENISTTLLHHSSSINDCTVLQDLLLQGELSEDFSQIINSQDIDGYTPLQFACEWGCLDTAKLLMENDHIDVEVGLLVDGRKLSLFQIMDENKKRMTRNKMKTLTKSQMEEWRSQYDELRSSIRGKFALAKIPPLQERPTLEESRRVSEYFEGRRIEMPMKLEEGPISKIFKEIKDLKEESESLDLLAKVPDIARRERLRAQNEMKKNEERIRALKKRSLETTALQIKKETPWMLEGDDLEFMYPPLLRAEVEKLREAGSEPLRKRRKRSRTTGNGCV